MSLVLLEDDTISRCLIFPKAFRERMHADELLWPFDSPGQERDGQHSYHESGVLRRLAPSDDDVHMIGCRIAAKQNAQRNEPPPGAKRRYYCGFRSAVMRNIAVRGPRYEVRITHAPEGGEEAHLDIELVVSASTRSARANTRTEAGIVLAEAFGKPERHICLCDENDPHHPLEAFGAECLEPRCDAAVRNLVAEE